MNVFYSRTVRLSRFHIYFQSPFQWLHCATHMIISVNIQEQKEQFNFDNDVVIFVRHLANTKLITWVFFNTLFMGTTMSTLVTFLSSYLSIIFQLEKQILATKSQSSNDLFSSAVLLLQVIFFSILFNVCDISELVSFNYLPQPCFFVFDNPTLAINIIHCGMNRLPFLLHLVKTEESSVLLNNFWEHKSQNVPFWGNVSIWKEDWPDFAPLFAKFFYILHTFIIKVIATVP